LYPALDRLLPHKQAIEAHLVQRLGELFALDYDLLLYDVTSTYFEGVADPAIAKRGYSRDHRPDCVQVNIALVVTRQGMPLGYEIFPGNRVDVTTVEQIVASMEARFGKAKRVWVMDSGMVNAENIAWLNASVRRYVIGTARSELRPWAKQIAPRTPIGIASARTSRSRSAAGSTARTAFCCAARPVAWTKSGPCTAASASASSRDWPRLSGASPAAKPARCCGAGASDRPAARAQRARGCALRDPRLPRTLPRPRQCI